MRKGIVARPLQFMQKPHARGREVIGVAKVFVAMERNDIERCKHLLRVDFDGEEEGEGE